MHFLVTYFGVLVMGGKAYCLYLIMSLFKKTPTPPPLLLVVPPESRSATEAARLLRACLRDEEWQVLVYNNIPPNEPSSTSNIKLTAKQRDILTGVAEGKTNRELADALGISPNTVDGQLRRIFHKMGVKSREEAVAKGIREGVI